MVTESVTSSIPDPYSPASEVCLQLTAYAKAKGRARDRLNLAYRNQLIRNQRAMGQAVGRYLQLLRTMGHAGLSRPRGSTAAAIAANALNWDKARRLGEKMLQPALLQVALAGGDSVIERDAYMLVKAFRKQEGDLGHYRDLASKWATERSGTLITAINEETRGSIRGVIGQGLLDYEHPREIARGMRGMIGLNERQAQALGRRTTELAAAHPGWSEAHTQDVLNRQADKMLRYRANMISRTETAASQSEGILRGFEEAGVELVEFVADSTACDDCQAMDGQVFAVEEAHGIIPLHPNCECCWAAVQVAAPEELPPLTEDENWWKTALSEEGEGAINAWKGGANGTIRKAVGGWGSLTEWEVLHYKPMANELLRVLGQSQKASAGAWSKDLWRGLNGVADTAWQRISNWGAGDVVKIDLAPSGWTTSKSMASEVFSAEKGQRSVLFHLKAGRRTTQEIAVRNVGGRFYDEAEVIMGDTKFKVTSMTKEPGGRLFFELEEHMTKRDLTEDRATALGLATATDWQTVHRRKAKARRLKKRTIKPYHRAREERWK